MNYHLETHDALRIASIQNNHSNVFYARLSIDFHEQHSIELAATALVYQEALLSGAGNLTRTAFLDAVNRIGGSISIDTDANILNITLRSRAEQAQKLLKLFTIMMQAPTFAEKELQRIKKKVSNELIEEQENARYLAHANLTNTLFAKTDRRYQFSPAALQPHVAKVTKHDLTTLHNACLTAHWSTTAGTDITAVAMFSKCLQKIKSKTTYVPRMSTHTPIEPTTHWQELTIASKQNIELSIGGSLPITIHHPNYVPFVFGLNVLGKWGGFTGRLMSTVREKEGLTYGIYARTESVTGTETGYWRIMTFFSPTDTERGIVSTIREITKIAQKGITEDEYTRFRTILNTQQILLGDSYVRSLNDLHSYISLGLTLEEMTALKEKVMHVSKADINKALRTYLIPETLIFSAAGPIEKLPKKLSTQYSGK